MAHAAVVGIGHTDWAGDWVRTRAGEKPTNSFGYAARAFKSALADAGLKRDDIDGLIAGPHTGNERMAEVLGLNPRWSDQGDAAISVIKACMAIRSGLASVVALVYGYNQRSSGWQWGGNPAAAGDDFFVEDYHAPWGLTSPGAPYAMMFQAYRHAYEVRDEDLGQVAVSQRAWASLNPNAIMRKRITMDDYLSARFICEPLRLFDYCLINDGGVALIITDADRAKQMRPDPVYVKAFARYDLDDKLNTLAPRLYTFYEPAQKKVAKAIFDQAGAGPEDMDMLCVYDSFAPHILFALEGHGYCGRGEAGRFIRGHGIAPGGKLPINTSGGHLSESYMQGWNHQIECVRQMRGTCGERQVPRGRHAHYASSVAGRAVSIIYGAAN